MIDWLFDLDWRRIWGWTWRIGLTVILVGLFTLFAYSFVPWQKPLASMTAIEGFWWCIALMAIWNLLKR